MTRALLALIALGLCSCATPRVAPRFDQPSTQPIAQSHRKVIAHVQRAQAQAKVLANEIDQKAPPFPLMKLQVASLEVDLENALSELNTSESERAKLDMQLKQQTAKANNLATDYDNLHKKAEAQDKIVRQVNSKWGLGAFAYGFKVLARHLIILAVVVIGLLVAVSVLGLIFPAFGAVLKIACSFISSAVSRLLRR